MIEYFDIRRSAGVRVAMLVMEIGIVRVPMHEGAVSMPVAMWFS